MPSKLELAIAAFRASLLNEEADAIKEILDAYQPARERLVQRIDRLVTALQERPLTVSELLQWERANELFAQIDEEVARLSRIANTRIIETQEKMIAMAGDHARSLALVSSSNASTIAQIDSSWNQLKRGDVEALAGRMADGSPLHQTLGRYGPEARDAITEALKRAVVLSTNPRGTARALERELDIAGWKLLRITRTETLQSYRSATLQNYRDNSDILDGWRWTSAHQTRTCLACLSLDGRVFPLTVQFQASHPNCRCSSTPIVKGEPIPIRRTGTEYFDSLSDADLRQMVPVSAFEDLKAGRLQLNDFEHLRHDEDWGDSYVQASVRQARENARRRIRQERRAA